MATKSLDEILSELLRNTSIELPNPPEEASVELQQLQQEGDNPNALVDELQRKSRLENDRYKDESQHRKVIYNLRTEYTPQLFWMVVSWLIFVAFCVITSGLGYLKLSDAVLIALITTTTATVIGIFIIALKWLFQKP